MQSSLGIYIDENIIKYAKLQKDKDSIKVEACNVVFYDNNLQETLNKIISETYSFKTPISINLSDEIYKSFEVSSLLSKKDAQKAIKLDYEMLCDEKGYNKASLQHKYLLIEQKENPEKLKTISIIANKNENLKRVSLMNGGKVNTITPISTSIANLVDIDGRKNIAIINIEDKTKITTIIDGQIYQINELEEGMKKILDEINKVENSYPKSYDVCKNMTIYTQGSSELYVENNEYMDIVTTVLYKIVEQTKNILNNFFSNIELVYITGLGTCINNIDLYFQDYIPTSKFQILKPFFADTSSMQIPIKEYIEVNSAIALALDGLGMVNKDVNFSKSSKASKDTKINLKSGMNQDVNFESIKNSFLELGNKIKEDFSKPLESIDKLLIRGIVILLMIMILFFGFSKTISQQISNKTNEVAEMQKVIKTEVSKVDSDVSMISGRTSTYNNVIKELTTPVEEQTDTSTTTRKRVIEKDAIPNLLNRIMFVIPKRVKITSIQNTTADHIVIKAEAEKYEQLGYFKAVLATNGILENLKSTSGEKSGSVVSVTIEGDLP